MSYLNLDTHHRNATLITTLTVAASGGDYTTVKAALAAAVAAASGCNWYRVYVTNGTYNEIQMTGGDYVIIEGESRAGVVIITDGTRTDVDPVSGDRYVDMAQADKHGILTEHTMEIRNLTWQVNDVKYVIHADQVTSYCYLLVYNCQLEHSNGYVVGCGARANQYIEFGNCTFVKTGAAAANGDEGSHGIFWHNVNASAGSAALTVATCTTTNCGLAILYELDSNHGNLCKFTNCTSGEARGVRVIADNDTIDYNINVLTVGGSLTVDNDAVTRPLGGNYTVQE